MLGNAVTIIEVFEGYSDYLSSHGWAPIAPSAYLRPSIAVLEASDGLPRSPD